MKITTLLLLSISLNISLFARLNPFEPTDHFLEQKEMVIKSNEQNKIKLEQEAIDKLAQEKKDKELAAIKLADELKLKELEAIKLAEEKAKNMLVTEEKIILDNQKELETKKTMKAKIIPEKVVVENTYIPEIKENFKILPFVKINVVNDTLTIKVDKKYKLLNQDILKPVKKLLFDFEGKVSFYTIRKDIISESFKSLAIGTHMEENFFRVVIDLPEDIINYTEKIDSQNGIITIMKKK